MKKTIEERLQDFQKEFVYPDKFGLEHMSDNPFLIQTWLTTQLTEVEKAGEEKGSAYKGEANRKAYMQGQDYEKDRL